MRWNFSAIGLRWTNNKKTAGEAAMGIEILALAAGVYAATWVVVLVGSRFFGPR